MKRLSRIELPQVVRGQLPGTTIEVGGGAPMAALIRAWAKRRRRLTITIEGSTVTVVRADRAAEDAWLDVD